MSAITSDFSRESTVTQMPLLPYMSDEEQYLFWQSIPRGGVCLEFGMGGSTSLFFARGAAVLYSVEGDLDFMMAVCDDSLLRSKIATRSFFPVYADIGPVENWSYPTGLPAPSWLNYHHTVWEKIPAKDVDFVLIDGRFRVACVLQCFLRCRPDSVYLIHDFTIRPTYASVLKYADITAQADSSVLLKRRARLDYKEMALDLLNAQFVPL